MSIRSILLALALGFLANDPAVAATSSPEEVVRQEVAALTSGDIEALAALFSEDATIFGVPSDPRRLVGEPARDTSGHETTRSMLAALLAALLADPQAPDRHEIVDMTSIGDLVIAQLKVTDAPLYQTSRYGLVAYRVSHGSIRDLWHIALASDASVLRNPRASDAISQLVDANNRGDVEAFLDLFDPDARNYARAAEPFRLSDVRSQKIADHATRGEFFRAMFATGAPVQVTPVKTLVFGDLVIAREEAVKTDGTVLDELSIYRVRNGSILDDWFVAVADR
jgi:hypothetical protein